MRAANFSVIIPLYNKAEHIIETLESVMAQTHPATEVLVVDDGSTDNGVALIQQQKYENVHIIKQKNQGVSAARNTGIRAARCEYVAFLDADDQWMPLFLDEMASLIRKYPTVGMYASRYILVNEKGNYEDAKLAFKDKDLDPNGFLLDNYFEISSKGDLPFTMSSIVVHQSVFGDVGLFPINEPMGEDQDFYARVALNGPIAYTPNILQVYRRDAQNRACIRNVPETECPFSTRLNAQLKSGSIGGKQKLAVARYTAAHLCHLARLNIMSGKYKTARALLKDPRCHLKPKHKYALSLMSYLYQSADLLTARQGAQVNA